MPVAFTEMCRAVQKKDKQQLRLSSQIYIYRIEPEFGVQQTMLSSFLLIEDNLSVSLNSDTQQYT